MQGFKNISVVQKRLELQVVVKMGAAHDIIVTGPVEKLFFKP